MAGAHHDKGHEDLPRRSPGYAPRQRRKRCKQAGARGTINQSENTTKQGPRCAKYFETKSCRGIIISAHETTDAALGHERGTPGWPGQAVPFPKSRRPRIPLPSALHIVQAAAALCAVCVQQHRGRRWLSMQRCETRVCESAGKVRIFINCDHAAFGLAFASRLNASPAAQT